MRDNFLIISLNGDWIMDYIGNKTYDFKEEPNIDGGCLIEGAVPNYWEDIQDKFCEYPIHNSFEINPLYTMQAYPQAGYVNDMYLPNVTGTFLYKRNFNIDLTKIPCDGELFFGGVQNSVSVWINGNYIGEHKGYSSDFSLKFNKNLLLDGENSITLAVSNLRLKGYKDKPISGCTSRAANECTGGIYGNVELRFYKDGLKGVRVKTSKDLNSFEISTLGAEDKTRTIQILDNKSVLYEAVIKDGQKELKISTDGFEFWSPDNPKLYTVKATTENQVITKKFGIRSLAVAKDGIHLTLNGKPFFFRGICEHGYYPFTVHPPRDLEYYKKGLKKLKKLGFNAVRFHTWIPMPEYMQAADELGMLLEVETPNNTTYEEWVDIVRYTSNYTSVVMYSSGNEMIIDEDYIEHLRKCSKLVHENTDSLFSPMSAMRGIEYFDYGKDKVDKPFPHNPVRLKTLKEFCDVFNSYSVGRTSYWSERGEYKLIDERNSIYKMPLLSHEICINGTYIDLSLKDRYKGTRIGKTKLYSSVEEHLEDKGLLDRAPLYFKNSVEWQKLLRKHCFETVRRSKTFTGYDFLGDIDHHWHTFGYCVGMMNEFYELKAGETEQNVLRYNNGVVLLADLPQSLNFETGSKINIPLLVSNYEEEIEDVLFTVRITSNKKVLFRDRISIRSIENGCISELYNINYDLPKSDKPYSLKITATLNGGNIDVENEWGIYAFPRERVEDNLDGVVYDDISYEELNEKLINGEKVLLFGNGPFVKVNTSFQIALAGRTEGHLATVINDHPLMRDFPHEGYCGWQFRNILAGGYSAALDLVEIPYKPIIEIASSYKYARREAVLFEYSVDKGKLLVCTLNLSSDDVGAKWLKNRIISYFNSEEFNPQISLTNEQFNKLCHGKPVCVIENTNEAYNANDITM